MNKMYSDELKNKDLTIDEFEIITKTKNKDNKLNDNKNNLYELLKYKELYENIINDLNINNKENINKINNNNNEFNELLNYINIQKNTSIDLLKEIYN
jgi:hypothetical protein